MDIPTAVAMASVNGLLYALRSDGAVYVLVPRGAEDPATGRVAPEPAWRLCPPVPGTEAGDAAEG